MKAFFKLITLLAFTTCLAMDFTPPKPEEIFRAIGSVKGLPANFQRAWHPGGDFEPLPVPKRGEWLAEHPEPGQTFNQFVRSNPNTPDDMRNKIYLQPLGTFPEGLSPSIEILRTFAAAYFVMDIAVLPSLAPDGPDIRSRPNPYNRSRQMLTTDIMKRLKKELPQDAFCTLAITMEDLYPDPAWNFVFGQASLKDHVGVFSFARYDPVFYGEERGKNYKEILLRRSCKVLAHEMAHMFSLGHCIFFKCLMNGSNHLKESDARPLSLCPACLRKVQFSIGFDVVDRYRKLLHFYSNAGFDHEDKWVAERLKRPRAVRAVGQALGRNPLPVIVPCHRVLNIDGKLGGYSGGTEKKRQLLFLETTASIR